MVDEQQDVERRRLITQGSLDGLTEDNTWVIEVVSPHGSCLPREVVVPSELKPGDTVLLKDAKSKVTLRVTEVVRRK